MIVRNRKGEDFLVKLFLALYRFEEFDDPFYGNSHTVRVLSVGNVLLRRHTSPRTSGTERTFVLRL